jgi:hypothetical protein
MRSKTAAPASSFSRLVRGRVGWVSAEKKDRSFCAEEDGRSSRGADSAMSAAVCSCQDKGKGAVIADAPSSVDARGADILVVGRAQWAEYYV